MSPFADLLRTKPGLKSTQAISVNKPDITDLTSKSRLSSQRTSYLTRSIKSGHVGGGGQEYSQPKKGLCMT